MIKLRLALLLLLSIFVLNGFSQTSVLKSTDEIKKLSADVAKNIQENKVVEAFNKLRPYYNISEQELRIIQSQATTSLNELAKKHGKAESFVKVSEQGITDSGFRETYLIKFENTALSIRLTYYKNSKGWIVYNFEQNIDFEDEFR